MSPLFKRVCLLIGVTCAMGTETACFGREFVAAILRMRGEHFFYENNLARSWQLYATARRWGGRKEELDLDELEVLLFGLDQAEGGIKVNLPLPADQGLATARSLVEGRLREEPRSAYYWSLTSDVYSHTAMR